MRPRKADLKLGPRRTHNEPRGAPREKLSLSRGCPRRQQSQWNAQGQLFAPIPSLRSCSAYRPRRDVTEFARWHARKTTMGRARAWGTAGHCGRVQAPKLTCRRGEPKARASKFRVSRHVLGKVEVWYDYQHQRGPGRCHGGAKSQAGRNTKLHLPHASWEFFLLG